MIITTIAREGATKTATATATATTNKSIIISMLGPYDVLCGRDKQSFNNVGNCRFRVLVTLNLPKYLKCGSKFERSNMIGAFTKELLQSIRFFKRTKEGDSDDIDDVALAEPLDEKQSRSKVAHALRDYASKYRARKARKMSTASITDISTAATSTMPIAKRTLSIATATATAASKAKQMLTASLMTGKSCQVATSSMTPIVKRVVSFVTVTATATSASVSTFRNPHLDRQRRISELVKELEAGAAEIKEIEQQLRDHVSQYDASTWSYKC